MKRVLIIASSYRDGGNSDLLADAFQRGAEEAGHQVERVALRDKTIRFCSGCLACQQTERCVLQDDMASIVEQMRQADVIVFATPIYFYEMSGQMKTLLDRSNPLFPGAYAFRDIYLLATAADDESGAMDGAVKGLEGWISCFEQARLAGVVRGTGVDRPGEIQQWPRILEEAYRMGRAIG